MLYVHSYAHTHRIAEIITKLSPDLLTANFLNNLDASF